MLFIHKRRENVGSLEVRGWRSRVGSWEYIKNEGKEIDEEKK